MFPVTEKLISFLSALLVGYEIGNSANKTANLNYVANLADFNVVNIFVTTAIHESNL